MKLDVQAGILGSFRERPFPAQERFYADPARELLAVAAVRSGKSMGGAAKTAGRIVRDVASHLSVPWRPVGVKPMVGTDKPRAEYWVGAPSYDLAKISWAELRTVLSAVEPLIIHETDGVLWLTSGVLVQRKTGADEAQLQGASIDGAWLDEICVLPYASYLQVKNRLSNRQGWLIMTGSPRPDSWVKPKLWDTRNANGRPNEAALRVSRHHWTTAENPWFPQDELAAAKLSMPDAWYRRDFEASWDTFVGLIYGEFREELHVVEPSQIPADLESWSGQDWGSASPGALVAFGRERSTGDLYVTEEVYTDQLVIVADGQADSWVRRAVDVQARRRLLRIYCDVTRGDQGVFQYRKAGLPAVTAAKGPGSILDGIKVMARLLHPQPKPRLRISSACVNLIREIRAYSWAVNKAGEPQDRVNPDCSDHALDALRMGLQGVFAKGSLDVPAPAAPAPPLGEWTHDDYRRYGERQHALQRRLRNRF